MSINISGSGIVEANLADNAVTLAKMAHGTDGELITYDATGAPANVAVGTSGQVLTSNGVGVAPTFQTAGGGSDSVPAFRAKLSASLSISDAAATKVAFATQYFSTGGTYSTTNYRWTPGTAGKYYIEATLIANTSDGYNGIFANGEMYLYKNGSELTILSKLKPYDNGLNEGQTDQETLTGAIIDIANTTDYYEIYVYIDTHTSTAGTDLETGGTTFQAFLIGGA